MVVPEVCPEEAGLMGDWQEVPMTSINDEVHGLCWPDLRANSHRAVVSLHAGHCVLYITVYSRRVNTKCS